MTGNGEVVGTTLTPYLTRVGDVALLSPEREVDLAKRAAAGRQARGLLSRQQVRGPRHRARLRLIADEGARASDLLVRANLRLVVSMARRYQGRGLDLPDLIQDGNLGLLKAVERFDHARGFRFSTYAAWWIRQAITRGLADRSRAVRLPVHAHELLTKLRWVEIELWQRDGRPPSEAVLADRLGVTPERLREIRTAAEEIASLDAPLGTDATTTLGSTIADDRISDPATVAGELDASATITEAVEHLDDRERAVIELRYGLHGGDPRTLEDIGAVFGVTRERIRQIELRGLRKLAHCQLDALLDGTAR